VTGIVDEVGGLVPNLHDTTANTTMINLSSLSSGMAVPQSFSSVKIDTIVGATLLAPVLPLDFGFNFDAIVDRNDAGQGSMRQFIINSNELDNSNLDQEDAPSGGVTFTKVAGVETSLVELSTSGTQTISPLSTLPTITDDHTHLTGYTHTSSSPGAIQTRDITIELNGQGVTFDALEVASDHVSISGLSIFGFRKGIYANTAGLDNLHIWGNFIGTPEDGEAPATPYGNSGFGLDLRDIQTSFVGTDYDGTQDDIEGNLISSNYHGIELRTASDVRISGNFIGTDKDGQSTVANEFIGIHILDASGVNVIGLDDSFVMTDPSVTRNVISGNNTDGIRVNDSDNQVVAGNYIGTNGTGFSAIANGNYGIQLQGSSDTNQIGTDSDGQHDIAERNIISGNGSGYRSLSGGDGENNYIAGNYIGTDASGFAALPNNTNGINIISFSHTRIGSDGDGSRDDIERNVISGNVEDGIRIDDADSSLVTGNYIGVGADGVTPLGNGKRGIFITSGASDNIIGYNPSMAQSDQTLIENKVWYNDDVGIGQ